MKKFNINKVSSGSVGIKVLPPAREKSEKPKERPKGTRPSWVEYYMGIAKAVSARASCLRHEIGCIIVKDKQIIAAGYNGAPSGRKSCRDDYKFCYKDLKGIKSNEGIENCLSVGAHAEQNAIYQASRHGISTKGADLFMVGHYDCCASCKAAIINSGIKLVYIARNFGGAVKVINVERDWKKHHLEEEPEYKRCKGCK